MKNDVVYLICHPAEGEPDGIRWHALTPLITALEAEMNRVVEHAMQRRGIRSRPDISMLSAYVTGRVQQGSTIIPLFFDLPDSINIMIGAAENHGPHSTPGESYLGTLANLCEIVGFAAVVLFGSKGVLARVTGPSPERPVPSEKAELAAWEVAGTYMDSVGGLAKTIMDAAHQTGCSEVEVQINDQARIKLTRSSDSSRSPTRLGRRYHPRSEVGVSGVTGSSETILVRALDRELPAFLTPSLGPEKGMTIVVWASNAPLPGPGKRAEIKGRYIRREEIQPLNAVPDLWTEAHGVFLVEQAHEGWR